MNVKSALRRLSRRAWIAIAAVVVVVVAAATWLFVSGGSSDSSEAETVTQTAKASLGTMEQSVAATGTVTPAVQDNVSFAVSGTVTAVDVAVGDAVTAGDTLATVDTLQLNAALLQAKSDLASAQATLTDADDANDGSTAAAAKVAAAEAQVQVAQASVDDAQSAFSDATLVAPASGTITAVGVAVGDKVSGSADSSNSSGSASGGSSGGSGSGSNAPGGGTSGGGTSGVSGGTSGSGGTSTSASGSSSASSSSGEFTIVSTDSWTVNVSVGESDIAHVTKGLNVDVTTDDGEKLTGVVDTIAALPSTTDGSAQYPVTIALNATNAKLYDGVSVDASIIYQSRADVLTVPTAAVTTSGGQSTVTLVGDNGTRTMRTVTVGERSGQRVEILSGLKAGDTVLVAEFTPGKGNSGQSSETGRYGRGSGFPGRSGGEGGYPGGSGGEGGFPGGSGGTGGYPGGANSGGGGSGGGGFPNGGTSQGGK